MTQQHWYHSVVENENGVEVPVWGCQGSDCPEKATLSWQRYATEDEVAEEGNVPGPYGSVFRNPQGPHRVAVFSCVLHMLPVDAMAFTHAADCPAPDPGCECVAEASPAVPGGSE